MIAIDPVDDGNHDPGPAAEPSWQESWYLTFYDPLARVGGSYHVGLQRVRDRADVWNWTTVDSRVLGHFQSLVLPVPEADLSDMTIGEMHLTTVKPLTAYRLAATYRAGSADVRYEAFTAPIAFGVDGDGVTIGAHHYETFGRVSGVVRDGNRQIPVSAFAFQDHSWGPRDWSSLLSHRWICATFGEELFFSVATFLTAEGQKASGYVYDGGFAGVRQVSFSVRMADDGYTPEGCDAQIWTVDGRGYHVTATCDAGAVNSHDDGWFTADGFAVFEMGGRLGSGLLEVSELKTLTPQLAHELGLATAACQ